MRWPSTSGLRPQSGRHRPRSALSLRSTLRPPAQPSMPPACIWASTSSLTQNAWPSTAQGDHGSEVTSLPQLLVAAPHPSPLCLQNPASQPQRQR